MKCIVCDSEFIKRTVWQKYCSTRCRYKYWDRKKIDGFEDYHKYQNIKKLYGMSREEYDKMYKRQNGRCAICGYKPTPPYRGLNVDHCHKTGKNRGLLCSYCNRKIIGAIEKIGLKKIINYLS